MYGDVLSLQLAAEEELILELGHSFLSQLGINQDILWTEPPSTVSCWTPTIPS